MEEVALVCAKGVDITWPEAVVFSVIAICVVCILRSI